MPQNTALGKIVTHAGKFAQNIFMGISAAASAAIKQVADKLKILNAFIRII